MNRRSFLISSTAATTLFLAGCATNDDDTDDTLTNTETNSSGETPANSPTDTEGVAETETSSSEYDAIIEYSTHVQDSESGEFSLPELTYDGWSWIVVYFEVVEGQLDMEDVWFNGLFETEERYYTVSSRTDEVENGIESRGAIRQGSRGVTLHAYPPSPASDLVRPMFSATDTSIGGEGVGTDGPTDLYPPVTVEYSVQTAQDPDVLASEYAAEDGDEWAVVTLDVLEGVLNLEDVWFRSQLVTGDRVYECDTYSRFADRGVRSRGLVKQGYSANALFQITADDSVEEWGYSEDGRQDVTIR